MKVWKKGKRSRTGSPNEFKSWLQFGIEMLGGVDRVSGDLLERQKIG